ncbi:MAG: sigma-54 dependent transcriptional regulator [Betaproteobacteria bacterium]|nr:sigma-54 dependent transcriptional regulator [Betaproteobacteria bacterium]
MIESTSLLPIVLVVDDEIRSQEAFRRTLEEDFIVFTASTVAEARIVMEQENVQVVLTDQRMPEVSGVDFLKEVREEWPETVRIIISGHTDSEDIIAGINEAGIYQYLLKPWQPTQLVLTLKNAAHLYALQRESHKLALDLRIAEPILRRHVEVAREQVKHAFSFSNIVCAPESPMKMLCEMVQRAARYDVSILLNGESGTGKELLARAIHFASSRANRPFIVENCGAIQDGLIESELFGHKKGAYTGAFENRIGLFQQAHGGTLFLDEIGETSQAFQVKLLRVLQEGEIRPLGSNLTIPVDVRVIAATNRNLEMEMKAGRFREDLYYRLSTVPLRVPPLRERRMDIPLLAQRILERASIALGQEVKGFATGMIESLMAYAWPGNVRELQNEILRMLVLSDKGLLTPDILSPHIHLDALESNQLCKPIDGLRGMVDALEEQLLREMLIKHQGNVSRAAQELGLSRLGLRNKMQRMGISQVLRGRGRPTNVNKGQKIDG